MSSRPNLMEIIKNSRDFTPGLICFMPPAPPGPQDPKLIRKPCFSSNNQDFKNELMSDTMAVLDKYGFGGRQGEHIRVVENTPQGN